MLKLNLKTLEEIDEKYHDLYEKNEESGEFTLKVQGATSKEKLDDFRNNNIALKKQLEELQNKDATVSKTAEELKKQLEEKEKQLLQFTDKKLLDEGKVEELLNARTDRMRQDFDTQTQEMKRALEEKDARLNKLSSTLREVTVKNEISSVINEIGVPRKGAMTDIMQRASGVWDVDDNNNLVASNPDGTPIFGTDGKAPITTLEWCKGLQNEAPFLFETNTGGGAGGSEMKPGNGNDKIINANDKKAFGENLEAVARGDIQVVLS